MWIKAVISWKGSALLERVKTLRVGGFLFSRQIQGYSRREHLAKYAVVRLLLGE